MFIKRTVVNWHKDHGWPRRATVAQSLYTGQKKSINQYKYYCGAGHPASMYIVCDAIVGLINVNIVS